MADFADGEIEPDARIIGGRAGRMSRVGPGLSGGRDGNRARGGHQLENVTPSRSPLVHVRIFG